MTALQKGKITEMRHKGMSYTDIAETLCIPVNTIKSYCYRNGLNTESMKLDVRECKNCGGQIQGEQTSRQKVFCCEKCKIAWWNKHRAERKSVNVIIHTCPVCGKKFTAYAGANRKYCSQACYRGGVADEE